MKSGDNIPLRNCLLNWKDRMKRKNKFFRYSLAKWVQLRMQNGFSLVEVNMAIFVMAIGILSMAVLFPLGLRESNQGLADLKQSSLADYLLNQAVAAAQLPDVKWSEWKKSIDDGNLQPLPDFIKKKMDFPQEGEGEFEIRCYRPAGFSGRRMVFLVQSTEVKNISNYNQYSNNPIYFAEAYFRGQPHQ